MNVSFLNFNPNSSSGPNSFGSRLATEMVHKGHQVLLGPSKNNLIFIETNQTLPENSRNILRLDGIWTRKDQIEINNRNIRRLYDSVDAVIWQSEYDKFVSTSLWGMPKFGYVVPNGIDIQKFEISKELLDFKKSADKVFVCSSNWHRQKRLKEIIDFFYLNKTENSKLLIMGNNPDTLIQDKNIFYLGPVPHSVCLQVYAISDWMIHLSWRDHCPNVVIEALSQGCPVICTTSGGTKELVKNNGIIINDTDDENIDPLIFDYDDPPPINLEKIDLKRPIIDFNLLPTIQKSYNSYMKIFMEYFDR